MHKIVGKIFALITFSIVTLGFICPYLVSAPSNILPILGYFLVLGTIVASTDLGVSIYYDVKKLKSKGDNV